MGAPKKPAVQGEKPKDWKANFVILPGMGYRTIVSAGQGRRMEDVLLDVLDQLGVTRDEMFMVTVTPLRGKGAPSE